MCNHMEVTEIDGADRTDEVEQHELEYYLPATAQLSPEPRRVERVLKTVFRRRGGAPLFVRR